jgi:hypothetical protein
MLDTCEEMLDKRRAEIVELLGLEEEQVWEVYK